MNPIIIPKNHTNKNDEFYLKFINNTEFDYFIRKSNIINTISKIKKNNIKNSEFVIHNFLYFVYRLIESNYFIPNLEYSEGGKPISGYEFINKNNSELLGVYHIHLSKIDNSIIVWYLVLTSKGISIKFEYLIHPGDDYKTIIKDIYKRNDDGYHFTKNEYFIKLNKLLNFNVQEKLITKFKNFLKIT